ncbi:MAG: glycosyltransferase family protein [Chloroherpetonaceae bacterium]|nr:glycosyltransferase family protein [Chloroherpetonaceae bacterium]
MSILVVVQARTGSSRLPNKTLFPILGESILWRQIERIQAAKTPFALVVATTIEEKDDPIRQICKEHHLECFSGHPTDLLDRHLKATQFFEQISGVKINTVVKIPSDCPLIDPEVIDTVLSFYTSQQGNYDFVSNLHPATYPDGNDVECMPYDLLELAAKEASKPYEREHTTPFFWEQPERFRIGNVVWGSGLNYSMSHRFTIDYQEDYDFIKVVYEKLYKPESPIFSLSDILALLENEPEIYQINAKYAGVNWYRHHIGELKTVSEKETKKI